MFYFFFDKREDKAVVAPRKPSPKKERWKMGLPEIGTVYYFPIEHIYYEEPERVLPKEEYLITEARVVGYFRGGYTEIKLSDGKTPRFFKKEAVEKAIFRNWDDAIAYTEKLADDYDRVWEKFEGKMRRGWRNDEGRGNKEK